jgi:hypothetical protein
VAWAVRRQRRAACRVQARARARARANSLTGRPGRETTTTCSQFGRVGGFAPALPRRSLDAIFRACQARAAPCRRAKLRRDAGSRGFETSLSAGATRSFDGAIVSPLVP